MMNGRYPSDPAYFHGQYESHVEIPWKDENVITNKNSKFPSYFKLTTSVFPQSKVINAQSRIPLGLIVEPCKVANVPLIDFSNKNIQRCQNCFGYLSPYCQFDASMKTWRCPLCRYLNKVDDKLNPEFWNTPPSQRTEVISPVYDMLAPSTFIRKSHVRSSFLFIIDVSAEAIASGFTFRFISSIKASLEHVNDDTIITIMTVGTSVSLYKIEQPHEDIIMEPDGYSLGGGYPARLGSYRANINKILDIIAAKKPKSSGNCIGMGLIVASAVLRYLGGVIICNCCGPCIHGRYPLELQPQDGSVSEVKLLSLPITQTGLVFKQCALALNKVSASLIVFGLGELIDAATLGTICGLTGGLFHYHETFKPIEIHNEVFAALTENYFLHASLILRTSPGIRVTKTIGNLANYSESVLFPILAASSSISFELDFSDETGVETVFLQLALLWTSSNRERRLRIFNFSVPTSTSPQAIAAAVDESALSAFLLKSSAVKVLLLGGKRSAQSLAEQFAEMASRRVYMPSAYHVVHAMLSSFLLTANAPRDSAKRLAEIVAFRAMPLIDTLLSIYPRLVCINSGEVLPLRFESLAQAPLALHMRDRVLVWEPPGFNFVGKAIGNDNFDGILPEIDCEENKILRNVVEEMYTISGKFLRIVVLPSDEGEQILSGLMIDSVANFDAWLSNCRYHVR